MSHVLIVSTHETDHQDELLALFNAVDGVYSISIHREELCRGALPIEVEEADGKTRFVRLPHPAFNGKWCIWVREEFVEELKTE